MVNFLFVFQSIKRPDAGYTYFLLRVIPTLSFQLRLKPTVMFATCGLNLPLFCDMRVKPTAKLPTCGLYLPLLSGKFKEKSHKFCCCGSCLPRVAGYSYRN